MILGEWSEKYAINVGPAINPVDVKSIVIIYEHSMSRVSFFFEGKQRDRFSSTSAQDRGNSKLSCENVLSVELHHSKKYIKL